KLPGPPTAKPICGLTIVCTLTPTSNNPPDTVSSSVSISSRTSFMTYLLGESPHTPREQPVESAGIPDLRDLAQVRVSPAKVNSGSHATNTSTEEADAVRVRRSSLRNPMQA